MYDFHMHSNISFDSEGIASEMVSAAEKSGLKEICFTDHYDLNDDPLKKGDIFAISDYCQAYCKLQSKHVAVRKGVEFGLTPWNQKEIKALLSEFPFDFVIGSVHYVGGYDPYFADFWEHNGSEQAFEKYLLQTLECVRLHDDFDVLGHLTYVCKSAHNPINRSIKYSEYSDICDEIMKTLISKGKGMEINTSGMDKLGVFLPSVDYLKRFKELGGEIITVGSDAHNPQKVGGYVKEAISVAAEVFGYVCTFEKRKVIYHSI